GDGGGPGRHPEASRHPGGADRRQGLPGRRPIQPGGGLLRPLPAVSSDAGGGRGTGDRRVGGACRREAERRRDQAVEVTMAAPGSMKPVPPLDVARIEEADARIRSLMPEPGRAQRLARETAAAIDGPLRGVAVGVKDIFHVDGLPTTAGSTLPTDELAGPEAAVVSLLRGAGAIVLGKTVSTEFALMEPGPTRNPHNLAHTPGGSSSGSAAAVAAGLCPLALGAQTIRSTVRPPAFCGLVGS